MRRIVAVDPGASGAFAFQDADGNVCTQKMPDGMTAQVDFILSLRAKSPIACFVIEKVGGYMPGNSAIAAVKFARHCGNLEAACYALGMSVVEVAPSKWMASIGTLPTDKPERKRAIKERMARLYPHLHVTLDTADSLGIYTWAINGGVSV